MDKRWNNGGFFVTTAFAAESPVYQELLEAVKQKEAAYLSALELLPTAQRETVESYLAACEALDYEFAHLAYEAGRNSAE